MDWQIDIYYLIFLGFAIHMTYIITKRHWISRTLDWCKENDMIDFDDD